MQATIILANKSKTSKSAKASNRLHTMLSTTPNGFAQQKASNSRFLNFGNSINEHREKPKKSEEI